jgi:transcriptional regulator with XRE-family HTH domain
MSSQQSPAQSRMAPHAPLLAPPAAARLPGAARHNALGHLIEEQFTASHSPCRSYAELERRSGVSREALSRYITNQPHRRRSPTVTTLAAIAKALDMELELLCRAAAMPPPAQQELLPLDQRRLQRAAPLLAQLTEEQFQALLRLLQQLLSVSASP